MSRKGNMEARNNWSF